jgi:hypothetical protein
MRQYSYGNRSKRNLLGWEHKMQKIYLVMGQTGEYEDYSEWTVKAFIDKKKAEELVAKASKRANKIHSMMLKAIHEDRSVPDFKSRYDPNIYMCYNGTSYFIVEVPLDTD